MRSNLSRIIAAIALSCLGTGVALSQNVTGSIAGVARDPSGAVVPAMTVIAINELWTYGNLGRNTFRGPGYASVDLGLFKRFLIRENIAALLRFEAFNALNRVNLQGPNGAQNNANFMRTTAAEDPRILQFAFRLTF